MKTIIVYYSNTGNNAALANRLSTELGADVFRLVEKKPRTIGASILDLLFGRSPPLESLPEGLESYDIVVFIGPVWMFHVASPFRSVFRQNRGDIKRYAWISVSGGALGPNAPIAKELVRRMGKKLAFCLDLNIAQYCEVPPKATTDDTGEYHIAEHPGDLDRLTRVALEAIRNLRG